MGRSEVILDYSFPPPLLELPAISQLRFLKKVDLSCEGHGRTCGSAMVAEVEEEL